MPWASFSMLDGPGHIIHIIVQDQDGLNNIKQAAISWQAMILNGLLYQELSTYI